MMILVAAMLGVVMVVVFFVRAIIDGSRRRGRLFLRRRGRPHVVVILIVIIKPPPTEERVGNRAVGGYGKRQVNAQKGEPGQGIGIPRGGCIQRANIVHRHPRVFEKLRRNGLGPGGELRQPLTPGVTQVSHHVGGGEIIICRLVGHKKEFGHGGRNFVIPHGAVEMLRELEAMPLHKRLICAVHVGVMVVNIALDGGDVPILPAAIEHRRQAADASRGISHIIKLIALILFAEPCLVHIRVARAQQSSSTDEWHKRFIHLRNLSYKPPLLQDLILGHKEAKAQRPGPKSLSVGALAVAVHLSPPQRACALGVAQRFEGDEP